MKAHRTADIANAIKAALGAQLSLEWFEAFADSKEEAKEMEWQQRAAAAEREFKQAKG